MMLFWNVMFVTKGGFSGRPTEPIERPCPPEQNPFSKRMFEPELMATQSSWFQTLAPVMKRSSALFILKPSVFFPKASPVRSSMVGFMRVTLLTKFREKQFRGALWIVIESMIELVRLLA